MIEHDEARPVTAVDDEQEPDIPQSAWSWGTFICLLAFLACLVLMIAPEYRLIGSVLMAPLQTTHFLVWLGSWLPTDFQWLPNASDSFISTNNIEFLFFIALAFVFYGAAMLLLLRLPARANYARIQALMWGAVALAGIILMLTPFLLSHDIFVYSDYGHTILNYHTNLYFTPPVAVSPYSTITWLDDWNYSVAAYGPLWLGITVPVALFSGDHPLRYIFGFRALGLMAHLINTWLVMRILRESGRSPRTVMLGTLLYTLNPLTLIESALGAHNDTEMITFLLLGILLSMRAERRGFARFLDYAPPAAVFTLAVLIKFTSLPILLLFLALLARKSMLAIPAQDQLSASRVWCWGSALMKTTIAGLLCTGIVLLFYAPFWIGHSPSAILKSFTAPPSSRFAEHSILGASQSWVAMHGLSPGNTWTHTLLLLLVNRANWNVVDVIALSCALIVGVIFLWRRPTAHTLTIVSLITSGVLLLTTPWFFAWYVTLLVALASLLVATPEKRALRDALLAFAIVFSTTAFVTYMDKSIPDFGDEGFAPSLCIFGIPLVIFLLTLCMKRVWPRVNGS